MSLVYFCAITHLGEHIYEGGHQLLPNHILDVDQPPLEPVVESDVHAVADKLVGLHLVIVDAVLDDKGFVEPCPPAGTREGLDLGPTQ